MFLNSLDTLKYDECHHMTRSLEVVVMHVLLASFGIGVLALVGLGTGIMR